MDDQKPSEEAGVTPEEVETIFNAGATPAAVVEEELDGSTLKISFADSDSDGGFAPLKSGVYGLEVLKVKYLKGLNYSRDAVEDKLMVTLAVVSSVSGKITDINGKDWNTGERNLFAFFNPTKVKNTQTGAPSKMRSFIAALFNKKPAEFTGEVSGADQLMGKLVKATVAVVNEKNKIMAYEPWDGQ